MWLGRILQQQVDYLMAENRILKERLGDRKLQLTDAHRRRLAVLGKTLGRKLPAKVASHAAKNCSGNGRTEPFDSSFFLLTGGFLHPSQPTASSSTSPSTYETRFVLRRSCFGTRRHLRVLCDNAEDDRSQRANHLFALAVNQLGCSCLQSVSVLLDQLTQVHAGTNF